jgi:hypothetical protein
MTCTCLVYKDGVGEPTGRTRRDDRCPVHGTLARTVAEQGFGRRMADSPAEEWQTWAQRFYPDLWAFYGENLMRKRSPEVDFGVMWQDGFTPWPRYRVSWVEATGEFYAIKQTLGTATVELLGVRVGRDAADAALDGWAEVEPMDLAWVRARLA